MDYAATGSPKRSFPAALKNAASALYTEVFGSSIKTVERCSIAYGKAMYLNTVLFNCDPDRWANIKALWHNMHKLQKRLTKAKLQVEAKDQQLHDVQQESADALAEITDIDTDTIPDQCKPDPKTIRAAAAFTSALITAKSIPAIDSAKAAATAWIARAESAVAAAKATNDSSATRAAETQLLRQQVALELTDHNAELTNAADRIPQYQELERQQADLRRQEEDFKAKSSEAIRAARDIVGLRKSKRIRANAETNSAKSDPKTSNDPNPKRPRRNR
jgi:hypothetical protein